MSPMQFTPDTASQSGIKAPCFEDARSDYAPGYATTKSAERLQQEIVTLIARLGGGGTVFRQGTYGSGREKRYGFEVQFMYNGYPAVIQVAALPIRNETPVRKKQALAHALYNVREMLQAALSSLVFAPGYSPLVQFMLIPGQNQTVGEALLSSHMLPNLNPSLPAQATIVDVQQELIP